MGLSHSGRKFRQDFGVYCCPYVFRATRPVLLVVRDSDGAWQFLRGHSDDVQDCHIVGAAHLLDRDPTLGVMAELWRKVSGTIPYRSVGRPEIQAVTVPVGSTRAATS